MPPLPACAPRGPAYPEVTRAICRVPSTPFSQAPWYTLPVHLCRFRVRSICRRCFPERRTPPGQSNKPEQSLPFVTSSRPGNIDPVPIGYGCRPRLRGRLTLRGLTLRRNPWTFGGSVSRTPFRYSCQHSHFRYLQAWSPMPFTGLRNAPLPRQGTEVRSQWSDEERPAEDRDQLVYRPCSIFDISWYSSRQRRQRASSTYPRSRQYRSHTRISSLEPIAIRR